MNLILQVKHSSTLRVTIGKAPKKALFSFLSDIWSDKIVRSRLRNVHYWWLELNLSDYSLKRAIAFGMDRRPVGGLGRVILNADFSQPAYEEIIEPMIFEDVWKCGQRRDFQLVSQTIDKYLKRWTINSNPEPPLFPGILLEIDAVSTVIRFNNVEELTENVDFFGYEWSDTDRFIDSLGRVYKTAYYNFGHPVGVVIPHSIERTLNQEELGMLLKKTGINFRMEE